MTDTERHAVDALAACSYAPGSWPKMFVRSLRGRMDRPLSNKQVAALWGIVRRFRRQLPAEIVEMAGPDPTKIKAPRPRIYVSPVSRTLICEWCSSLNCLACANACREWREGAREMVERFIPDTHFGIIADCLEENGFEVLPEMLRRDMPEFTS